MSRRFSIQFYLIESVLFQSPIINLLHLDTDRSEIIRFIDELLASLSRVDPFKEEKYT